jgi:hypothetical protein
VVPISRASQVTALKAEPALVVLAVASLQTQRQRTSGTGGNAASDKRRHASLDSRGTISQHRQQFCLQ